MHDIDISRLCWQEKEHLVEKLKETHHLPVLSEEEIKKRAEDKARASGQGGEPTKAGEEPKMDQEDFLKIMSEWTMQ